MPFCFCGKYSTQEAEPERCMPDVVERSADTLSENWSAANFQQGQQHDEQKHDGCAGCHKTEFVLLIYL
jgi:hypothetical protein